MRGGKRDRLFPCKSGPATRAAACFQRGLELYYVTLVGGTFKSKIFASVAGALVTISSGWAQNLTSTDDLAACLNEKLANHGAVDMSAAVEKCMPQGCKVTASMSPASAQPACNIANTQLPRVYLNCPGPAPGLRFRPTFTLCPNDANRIEVGEDVAPIAPSPRFPCRWRISRFP